MTEFDDVIRLLRENRPEATELELDRIKQRVRRGATRPSRRTQPMKSRLAILSMLVLGMLLSTTGAGLAVQGLTSSDASVAQYGPDQGQKPDRVMGEENQSGAKPKAEAVQPARQVELGATSNELPFTGFVAIPVLVAGVALMGTGFVLRRRTSDDS
jgi:hypothetical protein